MPPSLAFTVSKASLARWVAIRDDIWALRTSRVRLQYVARIWASVTMATGGESTRMRSYIPCSCPSTRANVRLLSNSDGLDTPSPPVRISSPGTDVGRIAFSSGIVPISTSVKPAVMPFERESPVLHRFTQIGVQDQGLLAGLGHGDAEIAHERGLALHAIRRGHQDRRGLLPGAEEQRRANAAVRLGLGGTGSQPQSLGPGGKSVAWPWTARPRGWGRPASP